MERNVKVDIPYNSPEPTFKLCKKVSARHTLLGAGSPLTGFVDMVLFESNRDTADTKFNEAESKRQDSEAFHGQALKKCGISAGQNKLNEGTLYWYVLQCRDILKLKNKSEEQNLEQWGFSVVISQTGARRNVRIDIPDDNPDTLTKLAEDIIARHTALGVASPLTGNVDITDFETKTTATRTLIDNAETADADSQALHGQAMNLLGYADGQTSETEGTLYYNLLIIRDRLLQVNLGEEDNLEQWGFKVLINRETNSAEGGTGVTITKEVNLQPGANAAFALEDVEELGEPDTVDFEANNSSGRYYASSTPAGLPELAYYDVAAGGKLTKTPLQIKTELGLAEAKPYLKVQNTGSEVGQYKLTFRY